MPTVIRTLAAMLLVALSAHVGLAEQDAAAVVRQLYAMPDTPTLEWSRSLWSARMLAAFDREKKRRAKGGMGELDFDFRSNSQDPEIDALQIASPITTPGGKSVRVTFKNGSTPNVLVYDLVRAKGRWVIDDVRSEVGNTWRLSRILSTK